MYQKPEKMQNVAKFNLEICILEKISNRSNKNVRCLQDVSFCVKLALCNSSLFSIIVGFSQACEIFGKKN